MSATAIGFSLILAAGLTLVSLGAYRWHRDRREYRQWEAHVAARPGGPEALEWLREQRVYWRIGSGQDPVPGLPLDGEPLSDDVDGEAEQFAGLICAYRAEPAPEPVYDLEPGDLW